MQPGISELVEDTASHRDTLQALHLTRNVAELDVLGYTMILNNSQACVKGPADKYLRKHCDTLTVPDPLPNLYGALCDT
jgi:hypothetical protein